MRKFILSLGIVLGMVLPVTAQQQPPERTACEEVRDGLANQIAQQATIIMEQRRMLQQQQTKIVELTKKPEEKKEEPKK